jgi:hypothetical protein
MNPLPLIGRPVHMQVCRLQELPEAVSASSAKIVSILDPGFPAPVYLTELGSRLALSLRFFDVLRAKDGKPASRRGNTP